MIIILIKVKKGNRNIAAIRRKEGNISGEPETEYRFFFYYYTVLYYIK